MEMCRLLNLEAFLRQEIVEGLENNNFAQIAFYATLRANLNNYQALSIDDVKELINDVTNNVVYGMYEETEKKAVEAAKIRTLYYI